MGILETNPESEEILNFYVMFFVDCKTSIVIWLSRTTMICFHVLHDSGPIQYVVYSNTMLLWYLGIGTVLHLWNTKMTLNHRLSLLYRSDLTNQMLKACPNMTLAVEQDVKPELRTFYRVGRMNTMYTQVE